MIAVEQLLIILHSLTVTFYSSHDCRVKMADLDDLMSVFSSNQPRVRPEAHPAMHARSIRILLGPAPESFAELRATGFSLQDALVCAKLYMTLPSVQAQ